MSASESSTHPPLAGLVTFRVGSFVSELIHRRETEILQEWGYMDHAGIISQADLWQIHTTATRAVELFLQPQDNDTPDLQRLKTIVQIGLSGRCDNFDGLLDVSDGDPLLEQIQTSLRGLTHVTFIQ